MSLPAPLQIKLVDRFFVEHLHAKSKYAVYLIMSIQYNSVLRGTRLSLVSLLHFCIIEPRLWVMFRTHNEELLHADFTSKSY